eukprot:7006103-Pyramimonas_sp.AAC.1
MHPLVCLVVFEAFGSQFLEGTCSFLYPGGGQGLGFAAGCTLDDARQRPSIGLRVCGRGLSRNLFPPPSPRER